MERVIDFGECKLTYSIEGQNEQAQFVGDFMQHFLPNIIDVKFGHEVNKTTYVPFMLVDHSSPEDARKEPLAGEIIFDSYGIGVRFDGYGALTAADDFGEPVWIELWMDELRLHLWEDINTEEPETFSLENARVEKYDQELAYG